MTATAALLRIRASAHLAGHPQAAHALIDARRQPPIFGITNHPAVLARTDLDHQEPPRPTKVPASPALRRSSGAKVAPTFGTSTPTRKPSTIGASRLSSENTSYLAVLIRTDLDHQEPPRPTKVPASPALRCFLGREGRPTFRTSTPKKNKGPATCGAFEFKNYLPARLTRRPGCIPSHRDR
jgi:hypothetical protein